MLFFTNSKYFILLSTASTTSNRSSIVARKKSVLRKPFSQNGLIQITLSRKSTKQKGGNKSNWPKLQNETCWILIVLYQLETM